MEIPWTVDYEEALRMIQTQLLSEHRSIDETVLGLREHPSNSSEEDSDEEDNGVDGLAAMRWLLVLVDPSIVYSAALGTYDMDITLMVAALSQRDPREYRPFIDHMRSMPMGYVATGNLKHRVRHYVIDKELKRWNLLLGDIATLLDDPASLKVGNTQFALGDPQLEDVGDEASLWKEAVSLMRERNLLELFLRSFRHTAYDQAMRKEAGDYLLEKGDYRRSLHLLSSCSPHPVESLLQCCLRGGFVDEYLNEVRVEDGIHGRSRSRAGTSDSNSGPSARSPKLFGTAFVTSRSSPLASTRTCWTTSKKPRCASAQCRHTTRRLRWRVFVTAKISWRRSSFLTRSTRQARTSTRWRRRKGSWSV